MAQNSRLHEKIQNAKARLSERSQALREEDNLKESQVELQEKIPQELNLTLPDIRRLIEARRRQLGGLVRGRNIGVNKNGTIDLRTVSAYDKGMDERGHALRVDGQIDMRTMTADEKRKFNLEQLRKNIDETALQLAQESEEEEIVEPNRKSLSH